jgi:hypothetical protein
MPSTAFLDSRGIAVPFAELEKSYTAERWQMPLPLLKALARQKRGYCDISVTELVAPPQIRVLKSRHEYAVDPFDQVWAAFGTGLHKMLESKAEAAALAEMKLLADFEVRAPDGSHRTVRLGGIADHYCDEQGGTLTNWKCSTAYKAKRLHDDGPPAFPDWLATENCYGYLWQLHGFKISKLRVCLLLKDWSLRDREEAANKFLCSKCSKNHLRDSKPGKEHAEFEDKNHVEWYPPTAIYLFELPVWSPQETIRYIRQRLELHVAAELCPDEKLPICTTEETWGGRRCGHWCEVSQLCHQQRESSSRKEV